MDTFTPEPKCIVCNCRNNKNNNETCNEHA
jgi:hypothetical protein